MKTHTVAKFLLLLLFVFAGSAFVLKLLTPRLGKPPITFDITRSAVVKQMQGLNRWETTVFTVEKIIEAKTEGNTFQQVLYGDRILLIAQGQVIAGFDLSEFAAEDVSVTDTELTIKLPPPRVLLTRLDSDQTKVYDRTQGLLSKGEKDLESQARQQAEAAIQASACQSDILRHASTQAENQLRSLFTGLGFQRVTIEIPQGSC